MKTVSRALCVSVSSLALMAGAQSPFPSKIPGKIAPPPRVFLLDAKMLADIKSAAPGDPRKQEVVNAAVAAADKAMHEGPFSVMQKGVVPPSGDKHDYM